MRPGRSSSILKALPFSGFFAAARDGGAVGREELELIHVAVSLALHCEPCTVNHLSMADDLGIAEERVTGAVLTAARVAADATWRTAVSVLGDDLVVPGLAEFADDVGQRSESEPVNLLVAVAVAAALGQREQLEHEVQRARTRGLTPSQLADAVSIGCSVAAGTVAAMADRSSVGASAGYRYWVP